MTVYQTVFYTVIFNAWVPPTPGLLRSTINTKHYDTALKSLLIARLKTTPTVSSCRQI